MKHEPQRWKDDYERNGYLVVEDVLDPVMLESLREGIDYIADNLNKLPPTLRSFVNTEADYLKNDPGRNDVTGEVLNDAIRLIMELPRFDQRFADLILHPPLLDVLEVIFETPEFHFHNYKCIVKTPQVSSPFQWHRDLPYLAHSSSNLITAMLCLDPMTEENGATVVMPNSHRIPDSQVHDSDRDIPEDQLPTEFERKTVVCPAGSAVLFHVNIIHGGGPNRSDIPRRNVIGIWAGPDAYPITGARYWHGELAPRSQDPIRKKQVQMSFPHLFNDHRNAVETMR